MPRRKFLRYLIILLGLVVNIAIAERASAGFRDALCEDPETSELYLCCTWCIFFCGCDYEFVP